MSATEKLQVLVTCPPMLAMMDEFSDLFDKHGMQPFCPDVVQTMSEVELCEIVPKFDGWIIGDDPATRAVFDAGRKGKLRAAVKWGIGVDNVDLQAADELSIPVTNTPGMFGAEVADVAICYTIGLARELFLIDGHVKQGKWPKPAGISLRGKTVGLVGYGDIGRHYADRAQALEVKIQVYDPAASDTGGSRHIKFLSWPDEIEQCDFIVFTCALNEKNMHMLDGRILAKLDKPVRIVNVARGPLIDESALLAGLQSGIVHSAALDVMEVEPLPKSSGLRQFDRCVFGSHNSSNTREAVDSTSRKAIALMADFLGVR